MGGRGGGRERGSERGHHTSLIMSKKPISSAGTILALPLGLPTSEMRERGEGGENAEEMEEREEEGRRSAGADGEKAEAEVAARDSAAMTRAAAIFAAKEEKRSEKALFVLRTRKRGM